ncbi:hypothetical protein ACJJTC_005119 [Scirpophaga incertulas]
MGHLLMGKRPVLSDRRAPHTSRHNLGQRGVTVHHGALPSKNKDIPSNHSGGGGVGGLIGGIIGAKERVVGQVLNGVGVGGILDGVIGADGILLNMYIYIYISVLFYIINTFLYTYLILGPLGGVLGGGGDGGLGGIIGGVLGGGDADGAVVVGGTGLGGVLSRALASLGLGLTKIAGNAGSILADLGQLRIPGTVDDVLNLLINLGRAVGGVVNAILPGVGVGVSNLLVGLFKVLICVVGSPGLTGALLGDRRPGRDNSRDIPAICGPKYALRFGLKCYHGKYNHAHDVLKFYGLVKLEADILAAVNLITNGAGLAGLKGNARLLINWLLQLVRLAKKNKYTQTDFAVIVINLFTVLGGIGNSVKVGLGDLLVADLVTKLSLVLNAKVLGGVTDPAAKTVIKIVTSLATRQTVDLAVKVTTSLAISLVTLQTADPAAKTVIKIAISLVTRQTVDLAVKVTTSLAISLVTLQTADPAAKTVIKIVTSRVALQTVDLVTKVTTSLAISLVTHQTADPVAKTVIKLTISPVTHPTVDLATISLVINPVTRPTVVPVANPVNLAVKTAIRLAISLVTPPTVILATNPAVLAIRVATKLTISLVTPPIVVLAVRVATKLTISLVTPPTVVLVARVATKQAISLVTLPTVVLVANPVVLVARIATRLTISPAVHPTVNRVTKPVTKAAINQVIAQTALQRAQTVVQAATNLVVSLVAAKPSSLRIVAVLVAQAKILVRLAKAAMPPKAQAVNGAEARNPPYCIKCFEFESLNKV